jgi:Protein of unknown function (DUF1308)
LPFAAAVWNTAKHCTGIIALRKRFYWTPDQHPAGHPQARDVIPHHKHSVLVDVVAHDGAEWVKLSNVTEKRLLFDMAKAGWVDGSSSEGSEAGDRDGDGDEKLDEPEGLLKLIEALVKSSRAARVRYKHPKVRIVLPRIKRGGAKEVEDLILQIQALGVTVLTSEDLTTPTFFDSTIALRQEECFSTTRVIFATERGFKDAPPLSVNFQRMVVDPFDRFSETINVDCTILLALVSDISHGRVEAEDWHHPWVLNQIEMEKESQLLPNSLWPAMGGRPLRCTNEAAKRMHEIVDQIGTKSEKQRRDCLMEVESTAYWSRKQRIEAFQGLSSYEVPVDWNIPITVVKPELATLLNQLPPAAEKVADELSIINQSVFLYGWAEGITTISSNRTVAKVIETMVEAHRLEEEDAGPDIWLCPASRSLVGKEKNRRK